ncbi:phospholipase effector Tle1 domain-containing protein [Chryseobacterium sp. MYb328]|uniref:phospholipase effector Tle1 domain-containing protein n=1 Tax=Chryseobacterium sp. MYb328 TaxID=2745231 RepID=UPI0030B5AF8B
MHNNQFGDYTPPAPPKGEIDIRIGVFFDGTQNNRSNTRAAGNEPGYKPSANEKEVYKKQSNKKDDSYTNDLSNVARKEYWYKEDKGKYIGKVYIEGIGTEDLQGDIDKKTNHKGVAYGAGSTGVIAKVQRGCQRVAEKINELKGRFEINTIILDVFGFSRGAAAARNFVFEVSQTKPRNGLLGFILDNDKVDYDSIQVRFLGVYDTVSSYDPNASEITVNPDFNNDVEELNLNTLKAKKIIHLCASDEHRENFMLTRVRLAGGQDFFLPGVHSDVGGCYTNNMSENKQVMDFDSVWGDGVSDKQYNTALNNDLNNLIEQGWVHRSEVVAPNSWHETYINRARISNRYSFIPLHIMSEQVNEYYPNTIDLINLNKSYRIPNGTEDEYFPLDLTKVKKRLDEYVKEGAPQMTYYTNKQIEELRKQLATKKITTEKFNRIVQDHNLLIFLRNRYLHWNSMFGEIGYRPHFTFNKKTLEIKRFRVMAFNS